jgi:hypothetical protein
MGFRYLPGAATSAYLDLLDALLVAPLPSRGVSFIRKTLGGHSYWYMKYTIGAETRWDYLGPDNAEVADRIARVKTRLAEDRPSRVARERLAHTARAAGAHAPGPAERRVYQALAQSGLFTLGGVLVGTHAWLNIGNMLGVSWLSDEKRTEDIDVGIRSKDSVPAFALAVPGMSERIETLLADIDPDLFAVPALNRKHPSTSFSLYKRTLRVDLLTPLSGPPAEGPRKIPGVGYAHAMRFLDFVMEDSQPAAVPAGDGVLVRVPSPGRFAIHKLVVAQRRPAAETAKRRKDMAQASSVIEALLDVDPGELDRALVAAPEFGGKFISQLEAGIQALPETMAKELAGRLGDGRSKE